MIPEIGIFSLNIASICCLMTIICPFIKLLGDRNTYAKSVKTLTILQFVFFTLAISILCYSFVISDLSVLLVAKHSHQLMPLLYKITGLWGNHEGSILLWGWELSLFTLLFSIFGNYKKSFKSDILVLQSLILGFIAFFIISSSNPFVRIFTENISAKGLNPLLQDVGLASHPPLLYAGYVGFSIPYSISIISLLHKNFENHIAKNMRIWALTAWGFLTIGITLGSLWAYRELGWGGFWFWDPVENASLMPWIVGSALIHSLILWQKRSTSINWSILLAIACFCLSLLGTFLVRSNVIVSVHSFATDPTRGIAILEVLAFFAIASITLYSFRYPDLKNNDQHPLISKETFMMLNNIVATTGCFTIIMATLYPIFYQYMTNKSITIGAPYFNSIFIPIIMLNILFASIGTSLNRIKLSISFILQIIIILIISYLISDHSIKSFLCLSASISLLWSMIIRKKISPMVISHLGAAILVIAITIVTSHEQVIEKVMKPDEVIDFYDGKWQIKLEKIDYQYGKNYLIRKAYFKINNSRYLYPETRHYPVEQANTTECAIYSTPKGDLYISIGDYDEKNNQLVVRIQYKPMMSFIWVGGAMLFIGAMLGVYNNSRAKKS